MAGLPAPIRAEPFATLLAAPISPQNDIMMNAKYEDTQTQCARSSPIAAQKGRSRTVEALSHPMAYLEGDPGQSKIPKMNYVSTILSLVTTTTAESSMITSLASSPSIDPRPTDSGSCSLHGDHLHCSGSATTTFNSAVELRDASYSFIRGPEPTGQGECTPHDDHWIAKVLTEKATLLSPIPEGKVASSMGHISTVPPAVFTSIRPTDLLWSGRIRAGGIRRAKAENLALHDVVHLGLLYPLREFIHLLIHAFVMFANECLGELAYEAVAPAIAMGSLFVFFLVDFFADAGYMIHKHQKAESGLIFTFCAIIFHQLFEGLGLGSWIATLSWPEGGQWRKWVMHTPSLGFIISVLEQRASGRGWSKVDFSITSDKTPNFISLPDAGILRRRLTGAKAPPSDTSSSSPRESLGMADGGLLMQLLAPLESTNFSFESLLSSYQMEEVTASAVGFV
ncbi:hypothetical protein BDZ89DRAFT_1147103 [Hymenopellis radicata]|nr:hypothetical protein BDZ89DRAFT_1147103 [Hymenopellis radicata]